MRLCFSIPELEADTHTHHIHLYELLEEIGKQISLFVVVDRPVKNRCMLKNIDYIYLTRFNLFPLRKIEQFFIFCFARFKGYKSFYVHYSLWNTLLVVIIRRLFGGRTYIWSCHAYKRVKFNQIGSLVHFRKWLIGLLQILTFKLVDYIVTGTASVAADYVAEFGVAKDKFIIIPNWVNPDKYHPQDLIVNERAGGNKSVAFIHSLTAEKGAMHLPAIMREVVNKISRVNFIIVGDGAYREFIVEEVEKYRLQEKVRLVGYIPNREIPGYLSSVKLLIMPSENEGFPRVLIEAMATGVPFVATDVGGVSDVVTPLQREYIVRKNDLGQFVEKAVELLSDDRKWGSLRNEGLKQVENFSIERVSKIFLEKIN